MARAQGLRFFFYSVKALVALLLLGLLTFGCGSGVRRTATAPPTEASRPAATPQAAPVVPKPCLALYALKDVLAQPEFEAILELCTQDQAIQADSGKDAEQAAEHKTNTDTDTGTAPDAITNVLARLEFEASWQTSLLLRVLGSRIPADADGDTLRRLAERIHHEKRCKDALKAFRDDAKERLAGGLVLSPLRAETLRDEKCRGNVALDGRVFVVVAGTSGGQVDVAFKAPSGDWRAKRVSASLEESGFAYWFTQVPAGSRVIIRSQPPGDTVAAQTYDVIAGSDYVTPASKDENARFCVQFEGRGDAALILLDGSPVMVHPRGAEGKVSTFAARSFVRRGEHQFVILDAQGNVKAEARLQAQDLNEGGCHVQRFDVTDATSSTLLVSTEPGCTEMGVVQPRVYAYAKRYLEAALSKSPGANETIDDMEPWAAAFNAIARLNNALTPLGQRSGRWDRGNLDTQHVMRGLAGELLRKGFSRAYIGTLSCAVVGGAPSYTFVVHRLDLQAVIKTSGNGAAEGSAEERARVLSTEQETVTELDDLRDLIRVPLARLLQQPYARLVSDRGEQRVFRDPAQTVELWQPHDRKTWMSYRVYRLNDDSDGPGHCADVMRKRRLVSPEYWTREAGRQPVQRGSLWLPERPSGSDLPHQQRLMLEVDAAGLYLLELEVFEDQKSLALTRDCINVDGDESQARYAAQLGVSPSLYTTSNALDGGGTQSHIIFSASPRAWSFGRRFTLSTPILLGYTTLYRDAKTPPSWNDLPNNPNFRDDGTMSLSWTRRALVLGIRTDLEHRSACALGDAIDDANDPTGCDFLNRLKLFARGSLLLDGGIISSSDIPASLGDFYDQQPPDSSLIDVDLTAAVQAGINIRAGGRIDLGIGAQFAWLGFDDSIGVEETSVRYDSLFALGAIFEMGYHQ